MYFKRIRFFTEYGNLEYGKIKILTKQTLWKQFETMTNYTDHNNNQSMTITSICLKLWEVPKKKLFITRNKEEKIDDAGIKVRSRK